jgi:hypothetical protein
MKTPRKAKAAAFDVAEAAHAAPHADETTPYMSDDCGTIAAAVLAGHPAPHRIERQEVERLVALISRTTDHYGTTSAQVGGLDVHTHLRQIRTAWGTYHYSPAVAGVFRDDEAPDEPGIVERTRKALHAGLRRARLPADALVDVRMYETPGSRHGFPSHIVELRRYEQPGTYETHVTVGHRVQDEFDKEIARIVRDAKLRWKHRFELLGTVLGAAAWARHRVEGVDGMEFAGAELSYAAFDNHDRLGTSTATCTFTGYGDQLVPCELTTTGHDDDRFAALAATHRRALKKLAGTSGAAEALTVHPLVAAAVRAAMPKHGVGMLAEIEAMLDPGTRHHPATDPTGRGISSFRILSGELIAPVTLGRSMKFEKDKIWLRKVKDLPESVVAALPGKPVTVILDHPFLKDMTVRTVLLDKRGLSIRPDYQPQPLAPLLEELRRRCEEEKTA